jgi:hypothetical protein
MPLEAKFKNIYIFIIDTYANMAVGANITYLAYFRQVDPTRLLEITSIFVCLLADK